MTELRMSRAGAAYIALRGYISWIINLIYLNGQFRFAYKLHLSECPNVALC